MLLTPAELLRIAGLRQPLRAIAPALMDAVSVATGKRVSIPPRGAVRSYADQVALWNDRANNPNPVAQPGLSRHEYGGALDLDIAQGTAADYELLANVAADTYGLDVGLDFTPPDKNHVQLRETLDQARAAWAVKQGERSAVGLVLAAAVGFVLLMNVAQEN